MKPHYCPAIGLCIRRREDQKRRVQGDGDRRRQQTGNRGNVGDSFFGIRTANPYVDFTAKNFFSLGLLPQQQDYENLACLVSCIRQENNGAGEEQPRQCSIPVSDQARQNVDSSGRSPEDAKAGRHEVVDMLHAAVHSERTVLEWRQAREIGGDSFLNAMALVFNVTNNAHQPGTGASSDTHNESTPAVP